MPDSGHKVQLDRRNFLKIGGASAATLGASGSLAAATVQGAPASSDAVPAASAEFAAPTKYPKLALITDYSPQKLAFATATGYEGVVVPVNSFFDPDKLSDSQIDQILVTLRETGARIISIECWGLNHIHPEFTKRQAAQARFIRYLEFAHRLGCKFCGTFSGGMPGEPLSSQAKEFAAVVSDKYLPVLERLDLNIGWENSPNAENFASVPAAYEQIFALVPSPRLGLEFDPSHFIRQYIDPIATAWRFRDRIRSVHAKDTEIIGPVLNQVGIHGEGWWRYRIPGQGLLDWPKFITVLLEAGFQGAMAVEHEDPFWDIPNMAEQTEFSQERKDGFILAHRFLRQYVPARLT